MEKWKAITGYPGYEISSLGRVRTLERIVMKRIYADRPEVPHLRKARVMVQEIVKGYRRIQLCANGKRHRVSVHHLVLAAFVGPRPGTLDCRHLNGLRDDNRAKNLTWGTRKENDADKDRHRTRPRGGKHGMSKLTSIDVRAIRQLLRRGVSQRKVASRFPVGASTIGWIARGKTWRHV